MSARSWLPAFPRPRLDAGAGDAACSKAELEAAAAAAEGRRGRFLSLRWRLTLAFTAVLGTMLIVFSQVIYWYFGSRYVSSIARDSHGKAVQVEPILIRKIQGVRSFGFRPVPLPGGWALERQFLHESLDPFQDPGVAVRIFDHMRNPIPIGDDNEMVESVITNQLAFQMAQRGANHAERLDAGPSESYYVLTHPVMRDGQLLAYIQILTSLKVYDETMQELRRLLVLGTLFAVGMSLLTGAALAQTAIAPIDTIARTAEKINQEQDLGRRIVHTGARDEIGRLALTINEMLERIECMFERQRQFLADVSHELRTPLTTIRGEVELAQRTGALDEEALEALTDESQRMSRMIDDLLMLARVDAGSVLEGDRVPVSLDTLVLDVYQQARMLGRGSHQAALGDVAPLEVLGDRDQLKQLLLNLVANAIKHTPSGTTVTLGLREEGDEAVLTVADDGPGIPPEDLPHLFERFYRADKARNRNGGSTGLGLAIVRSIAEAHGGRVSASSPPGLGARFELRLPLGGATGAPHDRASDRAADGWAGPAGAA